MYADKMRYFEPSIFLKIREAMEKCEYPICDLSVGTPDLPPPKHVIDALLATAADSENHKYARPVPGTNGGFPCL